MWWWLTLVALAGELYVNDTKVDPRDLQGMTLEKVDVTIDAQGDIRIKAPGYQIQVVTPAPAPAAQPAPNPDYGYPPGAYGSVYGSAGAPKPAPNPNAGPPPLDPSVPAATWWLVTEDSKSVGQTVEVYINGRLAQVVKSGEPQRILDVGRHVKRGENTVTIKSTSTAGQGGTLYVYIGTGSDRSGTVVMDEPDVQFGVGGSRTGTHEKSYTFTY